MGLTAPLLKADETERGKNMLYDVTDFDTGIRDFEFMGIKISSTETGLQIESTICRAKPELIEDGDNCVYFSRAWRDELVSEDWPEDGTVSSNLIEAYPEEVDYEP